MTTTTDMTYTISDGAGHEDAEGFHRAVELIAAWYPEGSWDQDWVAPAGEQAAATVKRPHPTGDPEDDLQALQDYASAMAVLIADADADRRVAASDGRRYYAHEFANARSRWQLVVSVEDDLYSVPAVTAALTAVAREHLGADYVVNQRPYDGGATLLYVLAVRRAPEQGHSLKTLWKLGVMADSARRELWAAIAELLKRREITATLETPTS